MSKLLDPFSIPAQLNNLGVLIVAYVASSLNQQTGCIDSHHSHFLQFILYGSFLICSVTFMLSVLYIVGVIDFCVNKICKCGQVCLTLNTLGIFLIGMVYHFLATFYGLIVLLFGQKSSCIELQMFKRITGIIYGIWLIGIVTYSLYYWYRRKKNRGNRMLINQRFVVDEEL